MENDKIHDYTDAYLESYLRALDKTHNPDLAIQTAVGVTMVLRTIDAQNEPKQPASAAADQSNGGTFWSHDAASSKEPARGRQSRRQRDRERRR